jgi:hypothetical protein
VPQIAFLLAFLFVCRQSLILSSVQLVLIFFLGRNPDYHKLNLTFAINVLKCATIISFFPATLKPCVVVPVYVPISLSLRHNSIVTRMLSNLPSQIQQEIEFIRPMVEERFAKMEEFGEDWDKPVCERILPGISLITWFNYRMTCSCGL